jgi:hypothetical protein
MNATSRQFQCGPSGDARLSIYTPRLSSERDRRELGFLLRPAHTGASWRWLKVFVGWTNPKLQDERGKVFVAEVETHRTIGLKSRTTYKTYVRLKLARGAPRSS